MPGLFLIDLDYPAGYEALDAPDITVYNPIHRSRIETWKIVGVYFCRIFDYRRTDSVDPNSALQFLRRRKNKAIDAAIDQRNGRRTRDWIVSENSGRQRKRSVVVDVFLSDPHQVDLTYSLA